MKSGIDIFHYINIYKREWRRIVLLIVVVTSISAFLAYRKPITYTSVLIALHSSDKGRVNFGDFNLAMGVSSAATIFAILESRRMRRDINTHFNLSNRPNFWWSIDAYTDTGGFGVEVTGPDPVMTEKIANFAVENLDTINDDLKVTTERPMVKVLDPAGRGVPSKKHISKSVVASGLFCFLLYTLFIFFKEYFSQMKKDV